MKTVRVVAAVICDSIHVKHKIYSTARGHGDYKGQWEFPGGKIEPGETPQQALKREIEEELDTEIAVHNKIGTIEYDYPTFHLSMDCFWCTVVSGELVPRSSEAPMRVKMRAHRLMLASRAGTKLPICAMSVISATWRI